MSPERFVGVGRRSVKVTLPPSPVTRVTGPGASNRPPSDADVGDVAHRSRQIDRGHPLHGARTDEHEARRRSSVDSFDPRLARPLGAERHRGGLPACDLNGEIARRGQAVRALERFLPTPRMVASVVGCVASGLQSVLGGVLVEIEVEHPTSMAPAANAETARRMQEG